MIGHSSLKAFPQFLTVTTKGHWLLSEDSVLKPQFLPCHPQLPHTARKARNLRVPYGNGLQWVDTLSFLIPPNRQLDTFTASQQNSLHNKEEAANRNKRKYKRKIPTGRTRRNTQAELVFVSMHLFLCLPLPQLHAIFPTAPPDLPITPLIVMFTGLALSSCWNVQHSLQTEPPDPVDATAHRLQLSTGRTHFNSHTHLGGLWDTKGTLTMTMNFCTWETGQKNCKWQVWKGFWLKDKQNTPQQSLSPWTPSYDGPPRVVPTAVPQKIPKSGIAHFAALQYQQMWPSEPPQTVLPELWHKRLHRAEGIPTWRSAGKPPAADGVTFTAVVRALQNWIFLHSEFQTE